MSALPTIEPLDFVFGLQHVSAPCTTHFVAAGGVHTVCELGYLRVLGKGREGGVTGNSQ